MVLLHPKLSQGLVAIMSKHVVSLMSYALCVKALKAVESSLGLAPVRFILIGRRLKVIGMSVCDPPHMRIIVLLHYQTTVGSVFYHV